MIDYKNLHKRILNQTWNSDLVSKVDVSSLGDEYRLNQDTKGPGLMVHLKADDQRHLFYEDFAANEIGTLEKIALSMGIPTEDNPHNELVKAAEEYLHAQARYMDVGNGSLDISEWMHLNTRAESAMQAALGKIKDAAKRGSPPAA